jgi:hypothetical protein
MRIIRPLIAVCRDVDTDARFEIEHGLQIVLDLVEVRISHQQETKEICNASNRTQIPASVEVVCQSCFSKCKSLASVTFESN